MNEKKSGRNIPSEPNSVKYLGLQTVKKGCLTTCWQEDENDPSSPPTFWIFAQNVRHGNWL